MSPCSLSGGPAMMTVIHLFSNGLLIIGFVIMWKGWKLIYGAKSEPGGAGR